MDTGVVTGPELCISTGAGVKPLRLVERNDRRYTFEMNMGRPVYAQADLRLVLPLDSGMQECVALSVGNPQCVVFVESFDFDWRRLGVEIERYPHFPNRTNVSFVRRVDAHTLEVRFFERGVGETMSSGTGSTGAMAAAVLRGVAESPVRILTPAGPIDLRWDEDIYLTGPAEIVAKGEFYSERV
jgi:diaminopimelate epimerase